MMNIVINTPWWNKPITINLKTTDGHNTEVSLPDGRLVRFFSDSPLEALEAALKMSVLLR